MRDTSPIESVIVEYGFLDNSKDAELLKNNWRDYAEAVVKSICEYIGVKYVKSEDGDYYIVKKGDTLWSIAKKYGMTVDKLKDINSLNSNMITIGMKLQLNNNSKQYVVKKGDTLWSIAKNNNTTVNDLMKKNNLTSSNLSIGQILYI